MQTRPRHDIYTTLDPATQRDAVRAVRRDLQATKIVTAAGRENKLQTPVKRRRDIRTITQGWLGAYTVANTSTGLVMNVAGQTEIRSATIGT